MSSKKDKPALTVTDGGAADSAFARKSDFFEVNHVRYGTVQVPGIVNPVRVRGLGATDWSVLQEESKGKGRANYLAMVVRMGAVNEDGSPMFGEADMPRLGEQPAEMLIPILVEIMRLTNATKEAQQQLEDKSQAR